MDREELLSTLNRLVVSESVRARVRRIRDNRENEAFDSVAPTVLEAEDIALSVNIVDYVDSKPNIIRILLRPDINIMFIIRPFFDREGIDDTIIQGKVDDTTNRPLTNMHYISGCSGAGKGYLMRETAWRTLGKCDNARIVYIPDFIGWTKCQNNNERLLYFYKAVMIGLADDEDFTFDKLGIDSEDSYTVDELMEMIIDGIAEYCKTIVIEGKPLRLLFCINNYKKTDDIIDRIIRKIASLSDWFFVLLKAKDNQYPSVHTTEHTNIRSWFSRDEAQKYIEEFRVDHSISLSDRLYDIVNSVTHYNPREMSILLSSEYSSNDYDSLFKSVLRFEKRRFLLEQNNNLEMRHPYINEPVIDIYRKDKGETIFRIYNNLPVDSPIVKNENIDIFPVLKFQPYISMEKRFDCERPENRIIEFTCPRAAKTIFTTAFDNEDQSLKSMRRRFKGNDQRKYEFAFATTKIAFNRKGLIMYKDGLKVNSQRILAEMAEMDTSICRHLAYYLRPGFNHVVFYSNANSSNCSSKTDGLDFISLVPSTGAGLKTFIIAITENRLNIEGLTTAARGFRSNPASSGATLGTHESKSQDKQLIKAIARAIDIGIKWKAQRKTGNCNVYLLVHRINDLAKENVSSFEVDGTTINVYVRNIIEALSDSYCTNLKKVLGIS